MLADKVSAPVASPRGAMRFVPGLYTVASAAILGAIFLVALAPKLDTDLWWHLKVGQYIANRHAVPTTDYLSFTFAGRSWTDHEWLSELLLYGLYRAAGLWGTIVGFAVIIWAAYCLVYAQLRMRGTQVVAALFILTLAFIASSSTWAARPQMITLLFLAVYSFILYRFDVSRDGRLLVLLIPTMLLWTNLHGGWVLGLGLVSLTLVGEWLNRLTVREGCFTGKDLRALALALLGCILITVVNPNGLHEVTYPLVWVFPTAYANSLSEWVSPDFHMLQMMFYEALLLILIASVAIARPRLNWTHLLLILAFTHLALAEGRNVAVWTIVLTPLVGVYVQGAGAGIRQQFPGLVYGRRPVEARTGLLMNLALLALIALAYSVEFTHYVNAEALRQDERSTYPAAAMDYLRSHHLPARVFNSYAWGGYLLWRGYPRYRDFIDGRANTLFDPAILHDYVAVTTAAPEWSRILDRYRTQTVLVERGAPLVQVLARDPAWSLAHRDSLAAVFVRRSA